MSFYNTKILTFISFIIFNTTLVSQIVDIETSRKEDLVGTKISLNLGFDGSSGTVDRTCLLYTSPSPRDATLSRMPSSA